MKPTRQETNVISTADDHSTSLRPDTSARSPELKPRKTPKTRKESGKWIRDRFVFWHRFRVSILVSFRVIRVFRGSLFRSSGSDVRAWFANARKPALRQPIGSRAQFAAVCAPWTRCLLTLVFVGHLSGQTVPLSAPAAKTPLMHWADASRLGRPFAKDPSVVKFGGRYLMYFSLPPFDVKLAPTDAPKGWSIGIAASRDLVQWEKIGVLLPEQECDTNGLCAPGAVVLGDKVHLFYQTYGNGRRDALCHAVSGDGIHFTRDASNPVFRPAGDWTAGRAIDADAIPFGDRLLLFFATRDQEMKVQMLGVASADLKSDFSRRTWKQLGDGPILKPELPWETKCIEAPTVIQRGDTLFLFYAGGYNNEPQQIACATSRDGLHWTRLFREPLLPNGPAGAWNASESGHPGVFRDDDGRSYLFFQGNNDKGKTWFLSCVELGWRNDVPFVMWNSPKFSAPPPPIRPE